jgi:hypothetical protein
MKRKGGVGDRWWGIQTTQLRPETTEWHGTQLTDNEMWSSKTVGLPMPPRFEPSEPFKALDVVAWNNKQVQYLLDLLVESKSPISVNWVTTAQ